MTAQAPAAPPLDATRYDALALALRELGHVHRLQILQAAHIRTCSPREVAQLLDVSLGALAYHFRAMAADGLLELDHETMVRGAVQHHYRLTRKGRRLHRQLLGDDKAVVR